MFNEIRLGINNVDIQRRTLLVITLKVLIALVPFVITTWMLIKANYGWEFSQMGIAGYIEIIMNFLPLYFFVITDFFRRRQGSILITFVQASFYIYLLSVLYLTVYFIPFRDISFNGWFNFQSYMMVNLEPFNILKDYQIFNRQILGNFIMLFPLGLYLPLLYPKINNLKVALLRLFLIALSIELIQFFFTYVVSYQQGGYGRSVDIDDVILNFLGSCIGFIVSNQGLNWLKYKIKNREVSGK